METNDFVSLCQDTHHRFVEKLKESAKVADPGHANTLAKEFVVIRSVLTEVWAKADRTNADEKFNYRLGAEPSSDNGAKVSEAAKQSYADTTETSYWRHVLKEDIATCDQEIHTLRDQIDLYIAEQRMQGAVEADQKPKTTPLRRDSTRGGFQIAGNCVVCGRGVSKKVVEYSTDKFGKVLCMEHQEAEANR